MPRLARKRPYVVEYVHYTDESRIEVIDFLRAGKVHFLIKSAGILIRTPNGDMLAQLGDYIIRGLGGEFYPCGAENFTIGYEDYKG